MNAPDSGHANIPVLEVENLCTRLSGRAGSANVVDGVSFDLRPGETLGIVGESGSGKTMLGMSLLRLLPKAAQIDSGSIRLGGRDITKCSPGEMRRLRGAEIALIPQDPMVSLDPLFRVGSQIGETLRAHGDLDGRHVGRRMVELLRQVQIPDPERRAAAYPFEMSGGMRQRVVGAIGIACNPRVLIADEPTTALDVTVQAQYLSLLKQLQRETGVALILITHDFGVVAQICDRVAVMYAGRIVEQAEVNQLFDSPVHPYSKALMDASAAMANDNGSRRFPSLPGEPPPLFGRKKMCSFAPRCAHAREQCFREEPDVSTSDSPDHRYRCFFPLGQETQ